MNNHNFLLRSIFHLKNQNSIFINPHPVTYGLKIIILFSVVLAIAPSKSIAQIFIDVFDFSGISEYSPSNGISMADYDLDGDLDIYIVGALKYDVGDESTWNRFYRNDGDGKFSEVTEEANVRGPAISPREGSFGSQFGAAWGDFNNDNYPDLYLTNFGYNVLYKNNGDGTFTDISEKAGVRGPINDQHSSACWWDYDLDGDLDLYASAYIGRNIMFENVGQDTFMNVTVKTGLGDRGLTWTSLPFDANNNLLPDLYVVNDFGANKFYLNQGDGTFVESTSEFGLEDEGHGMGISLGDYDNDGDFDIYLTNISSEYPCPLFQNQGDGTFINKGAEVGVDDAGWAWGTDFFDFDNDGALDLFVVNGFVDEPGFNHLFYNVLESNSVPISDRKAYFLDISDSSGVNSSEEARALVMFDNDDDGDLDMIVSNWFSNPHLFENESETKNWLKIKLEGTVSNRNAFGASVSVICGEKKYFRSNDGIDFLGQSILPLHFGLAKAETIDTITVTWPNGEKELIVGVEVNQEIKIVENYGLVSVTENENGENFISDFYLIGNYPNPFNSTTNIVFYGSSAGVGQIKVFNMLGQEVYTKNLVVNHGQNSITWHGINNGGKSLSNGAYLYSITYNHNQKLTGKLLILK